MENADIWLTPLLLLPGVGLLIMSTAARYGQLQATIQQLTSGENDTQPGTIELLIQRARFFRNALSGLYTSVGLFTLASFLHGITKLALLRLGMAIVVILSFVGMISLIFASYELLRESLLSMHIIQHYQKDR